MKRAVAGFLVLSMFVSACSDGTTETAITDTAATEAPATTEAAPTTTEAPTATVAPATTQVPTTTVTSTTVAPTTTQVPTTTATPTTVTPTTTVEIPEKLFVASRWISDACDPAAATRLHQVHTPNISSGNVFGALIDPAPEGLDFWIPPDPMPGEPGDVIWARHDADLEGGTAYLILYRSESVCGEPRAVSAWIAIPDGEAPQGGRPILSWGHGTRGAGDHCAGTRSGYMYQEQLSDTIGGLLSRGFVVVASDYEGSGTPGMYAWAQSSAQGKNLLDAARAAGNFAPAGAGNRTVLTGFSVGGHAMSKANEIASVYAPDLDLIGVIGLLAGVVKSSWVPELLMRSSARGYIVLGAAVQQAIWGAELAPASRILTDLGVSHLDVLEEQCMTETNEYFMQFEPEDIFKFPYDSTFSNGVDPSVVNAIGQGIGAAPVILIHPTDDPAVPPAALIEYVETVCQYGQPITVSWHENLPHSIEMFTNDGVVQAIFTFVDSRLNGGPAETHCGQIPEVPGGGAGTVGVPCTIFESEEAAEQFFDANPELGAGLDTNGDGIPCGPGDTQSIRSGYDPADAGCGWFDSQAEAQEFFDANPTSGTNLDGNNDGTACGVGDWGGLSDCANGLVLARFCEGSGSSASSDGENVGSSGPDPADAGSSASSDGENVGSSGPDPADASCGWFDSQAEAQEFFDANPTSGTNLDGNNDGTACGVGDWGGLTDCGGLVQELVLPQSCP